MIQPKYKRTHKKEWQDKTRNQRQSDRNKELNQIAGEAGYFSEKTGEPSWSAYCTAVIKREVKITPR